MTAQPIPRRPLSRRQITLLAFIADYIRENGWAPSIREMCKATGLRSTSSVSHQLTVLEARGWIVRKERAVRALRVVKDAA